MLMKLPGFATFLVCAALVFAQQPAADSNTQLLDITQRLLDAIASGEKSLWEQYLANDVVFTGDDGRTLTKQQFLEELRPLPKGYSGSIKLENPQVRNTADTTVISYDLLEHENVLDQMLTVHYHTTDTWLLRNGKWQMIASQALRQYADPIVGAVNPSKLDDYVGTYQLSPDVQYVVSGADGRLLGQRTGRAKEDLLPETPDVFFRKGSPNRKIFVRDPGGQVVEIRDRLAGVDLVWKRTGSSATNVGAMNHAHGSFDVKITPQSPDNDVSKAANLGRMTIDKQFHGDLEGTSKGEMLSAMSGDVKNSGVYVAIERVIGTLAGRQGSFVLHHTGIMDRGRQRLSITVAPDSGTEGLKGITGTMNITITPEGKHFYDFDYQVAAAGK